MIVAEQRLALLAAGAHQVRETFGSAGQVNIGCQSALADMSETLFTGREEFIQCRAVILRHQFGDHVARLPAAATNFGGQFRVTGNQLLIHGMFFDFFATGFQGVVDGESLDLRQVANLIAKVIVQGTEAALQHNHLGQQLRVNRVHLPGIYAHLRKLPQGAVDIQGAFHLTWVGFQALGENFRGRMAQVMHIGVIIHHIAQNPVLIQRRQVEGDLHDLLQIFGRRVGFEAIFFLDALTDDIVIQADEINTARRVGKQLDGFQHFGDFVRRAAVEIVNEYCQASIRPDPGSHQSLELILQPLQFGDLNLVGALPQDHIQVEADLFFGRFDRRGNHQPQTQEQADSAPGKRI